MRPNRKKEEDMSEETKEPKTLEDLWLMRETSGAWFDGQLSDKLGEYACRIREACGEVVA